MTHKFYILNKPIQYKEQPVYGVIASAYSDEICLLLAMDMVKQAVVECGWVLGAMDLAISEVVGYLPTCYDFQDGYLTNEECYHYAMDNSLVLYWFDIEDFVDAEDINCEAYKVKNTNRKQIASYDEYTSRQGKEKKFEDVTATKRIIVGCEEFAKLNEKQETYTIKNREMKNIMSRDQYVCEKKIKILDKIDPEQLPKAEDGFDSPIGSYLSAQEIDRQCGDYDDILDELGDEGIIYTELHKTYWKKRKEGGLVRIK